MAGCRDVCRSLHLACYRPDSDTGQGAPLDEWKKRRATGQISDLDNQYGDPDKVGGIPLPGASFGKYISAQKSKILASILLFCNAIT